MKQHTLYLGLVTRANAAVKPSARNAILDDTARTFGGFISIPATGGYTDTTGYTGTEPAIKIEVLTDAPMSIVRAWAERARLLANQESVLLTSRDINAEFIGLSAPIVEHTGDVTNAVH